MGGNFLSNTYVLDDSEGDVTSFTKQFHVMFTIMLCTSGAETNARTSVGGSCCHEKT